ncbi:MAG TPA: tetratricopeptide repeat protein, partial [Caulobacteraceae bacterium]|nr:tetratricopeptide repeat protein [Caulobacteraceae bacterium]
TEYLIEERAVLKKQERLLDIQIEHLDGQTPFNRAHLRNRRWRERLQLGLQAFVVIAATVAGLILGAMIYGAFTSKQVVVDAFDAPPAMAQRGLTGRVVASGLLDELTRLQAANRTSLAKRNLSGAWVNDIKIEVPETGVSIGEIDRYLKQRFGHDVHIGGDLVETDSGGLALTVRGDGILPKTFTGGAADLGKLTTQAAEYIYGNAEPAQYVTYLENMGRTAEAIAFAQAALPTAPKSERPYLLNAWGNGVSSGGDTAQSLTLYREALRLKPDLWPAWNNVINGDWVLGREEGAWRDGEALRRAAGGRPGRAPELYYLSWDTLTWDLLAWRNALAPDLEANGGTGTGLAAGAPLMADVDIRLHDLDDADLQLRNIKDDPNDPTVAAMRHFIQGRIAEERGDLTRAASELEAFGAGFSNPMVWSNYPGYSCWVAPVEEATGHPDKADAVLAKGGTFVDCYRFKADILDHRGDWAGAQRQYAAAVALAPDLPAAYYSWGMALVRHGDLKGAMAKFAAANKRGPHWADPLKAWGDVLARQGKWDEALKKYRKALSYAPAWSELRRAEAVAGRKAV